MIGREDEVREYRGRVNLFYGITLLAMFVLLGRLFTLQVVKGEVLRKYSESNRLKKEKLFPTRGIIFDRDGRVVVDNRAAFDVILLSQYYPFTEEMDQRLAKALEMEPAALQKKLAKAKKLRSFHPVLLRADVSKDIVANIEMDAEGFPGIDIEATVQRRYPYGEMASQLLGYIGEVTPADLAKSDGTLTLGDYIGKRGIERYYDSYLRGKNGIGYVEVDARGRRRRKDAPGEKLLGYVAQTDPVPGQNLHLTIDIDLELIAAYALKKRDFNGAVVALDPRSGEVLAMVNDPSYNPADISGREIDPAIWAELSQNKLRPLRNRAIQDHYPPGSTFKLFVALAGLAEGTVDPKAKVNCQGHLQFGRRRFHCWKRHGVVDFVTAIRESCDVYFYKLGDALGIDMIAKYARLFGLGKRTRIHISGENSGLIPDTEWKKKRFNDIWHPGETLSVAIGQGFVDVTPIQLVSGFASIGNSGFLYRPFVVRRIEKRGGELIREYQPELTRRIDLPEDVFKRTKEGLFQVVNQDGGTARRAQSQLTEVSGKTGTAQVRAFKDIMKQKCELMPVEDRHHGWFVGYAPRENPEIAVVAIAEHACHGSSAAPVVKEVIEAYIQKKEGKFETPTLAKLEESILEHQKYLERVEAWKQREREKKIKERAVARSREANDTADGQGRSDGSADAEDEDE